MEVRRQTCQACHSQELRNLLVREEGKPMTIYVQCNRCHELVAQYKLRSYYHHGKDAESFLKSAGAVAAESGRDLLQQFHQTRDEAVAGFEHARQALSGQSPES